MLYDTAQIVRQEGATNAFDASNIVFRDCLSSAATTALYAGLLEAPVAAIENYIHYQKGRKTGEEAIKDAAVAIAKRGRYRCCSRICRNRCRGLPRCRSATYNHRSHLDAHRIRSVWLQFPKAHLERTGGWLAAEPSGHLLLQSTLPHPFRLRNWPISANALGIKPIRSYRLNPYQSRRASQ